MVEFKPEGVIPAVLLPFHSNGDIDWESYGAHLRDVAAVDGITGITVNGHSQEIPSLTPDEQARVIDFTLEQVGDRIPVLAGIYQDGSDQAAALARQAQAHGAHGLLIFPSDVLAMGGYLRPEMAYRHYETIAAQTTLPMIAFEYALSTGKGYTLEALLGLAERVPNIVAIKDMSHDPQLHEKHIRALHAAPRRIAVLSTHSSWLFSSLVLGCDGLLSGAGSVIAPMQVELFRAVQAGDLRQAQAVAARMFPIASAFYSAPMADMHNRMKEALVILGRIPDATVRPPLAKIHDDEIDRIRVALVESGLLVAAGVGA